VRIYLNDRAPPHVHSASACGVVSVTLGQAPSNRPRLITAKPTLRDAPSSQTTKSASICPKVRRKEVNARGSHQAPTSKI
jgi:hypothetical protein